MGSGGSGSANPTQHAGNSRGARGFARFRRCRLVQVKEPGEYVEVAKSGGSILVDDAGETVHMSAPIRAISSTVDQLAAAGSNPL